MKVTQLCPTLCDPMDYAIHGILQARILEWVAVPISRGSSQPRDWTQVSCIAGGFFTSCATREAYSWPHGQLNLWYGLCLLYITDPFSSFLGSQISCSVRWCVLRVCKVREKPDCPCLQLVGFSQWNWEASLRAGQPCLWLRGTKHLMVWEPNDAETLRRPGTKVWGSWWLVRVGHTLTPMADGVQRRCCELILPPLFSVQVLRKQTPRQG